MLTIAPGAGRETVSSIAQFWDRNTLQLDLTAAGAQGARHADTAGQGLAGAAGVSRAARRARDSWKCAVRSEQTFAVPAQGAPLLLKLSPSVYDAATERDHSSMERG